MWYSPVVWCRKINLCLVRCIGRLTAHCLMCSCPLCRSSRVEEVTHAYSTQRPSWQSSSCAADAECQVLSTVQQACLMSSPAGVAPAALSSGGKPAVLPLVADATASSASLAAEAAPQSVSPQPQQRSMAKHSRDEQQSSSTHWAQQVVKVMRWASCLSATPVPERSASSLHCRSRCRGYVARLRFAIQVYKIGQKH